MKETPEQMESDARSLILYILDADRRGAPASDILATVERRLAALVAAQRERDAQHIEARAAAIEDGQDAASVSAWLARILRDEARTIRA